MAKKPYQRDLALLTNARKLGYAHVVILINKGGYHLGIFTPEDYELRHNYKTLAGAKAAFTLLHKARQEWPRGFKADWGRVAERFKAHNKW